MGRKCWKNIMLLTSISFILIGCGRTPTAEVDAGENSDANANTLLEDAPLEDSISGGDSIDQRNTSEEVVNLQPADVTSVDDASEEDDLQRLQKYQSWIVDYQSTHVLPTGETLSYFYDEDSFAEDNRFAIADVDGDGRSEFILHCTDGTMAGTVTYVYEYDVSAEELHTEVEIFDGDYYVGDKSYIVDGWSHNQGVAGDFWPYTVYLYDEVTDTYEFSYGIDAWSKEAFPENYEGNSYPDELDISRTGYLYYILAREESDYDTPSDTAVYEELVDRTYGASQKLSIRYLGVTQGNATQKFTLATFEGVDDIDDASGTDETPDAKATRLAREHIAALYEDPDIFVYAIDEVDGDIYTIHVYEDFPDHTATADWLTVDLQTGEVTGMFE